MRVHYYDCMLNVMMCIAFVVNLNDCISACVLTIEMFIDQLNADGHYNVYRTSLR